MPCLLSQSSHAHTHACTFTCTHTHSCLVFCCCFAAVFNNITSFWRFLSSFSSFTLYFLLPSVPLPPSLSLLLPFLPSEGQWSSLPPHKRREKEVFLASEKRASKGFISQANNQLELLDSISEEGVVAECLRQPPLGRRTAAAVRHGKGRGGGVERG